MTSLIRLLKPIRFLFSRKEECMDNEVMDKDLGRILFVRNKQAKKIIARRKEDHIRLTIPYFYTEKRALEVLEQLKPRLLAIKSVPTICFTEQTKFKTLTFEVNIEKSETLQNYYGNLKLGVLHIVCPASSDFDKRETQIAIKTLIEKALRVEAKRILPSKVQSIAKQFGFQYSDVKVNSSRSRWGSCSSKGSINFSYTCLLLPIHLVDFVILHELCHTVHMNHSEDFWSLLNKVSDNKVKLLTKELKNYSTNW